MRFPPSCILPATILPPSADLMTLRPPITRSVSVRCDELLARHLRRLDFGKWHTRLTSAGLKLTLCSLLVFVASQARAGEEQVDELPADVPAATQAADVSKARVATGAAEARMTPQQFLNSYCVACHEGDAAESGLDFAAFAGAKSVLANTHRWRHVAERVHSRQMPPRDETQPEADDRDHFVAWIESAIHQAICDDGTSAGPARTRRLNQTEYANTIRDLLGIHINAAHALPADGGGGEGFDNAAETLFISPIHAEKYLEAARSALDHALKDPRAVRNILVAKPSDERPPRAAAEAVLKRFLRLAFRRPVTTEEVDSYLHLFELAAKQDGATYESAIQLALEAALVSPKFLFLWEEATETLGGEASEVGATQVLVSQYEMASRLSYFMWASMPDEELFRLADEGRLHEAEVLKQQVARMLHSPVNRQGLRSGAKVRDFATSFVEQWLGTRELGREFKPDPKVARRYDSELEGGMKYEPVFFFEDILSDNRSLLNLIDSDFTYVNRRLARHYRIPGEFREQPRKVDLPEDSHRGGVLGMSAVLAVSSYPHRTSPVLRGKWIMEKLLGTPPPPPPPDVEALDESDDLAEPASLRERFELHRANAVCASCHDTIDPLGFGLENFDVLGRWRSESGDTKIDARGKLPDGSEFEGPDQLKQLLLDRKEMFVRNLTSKLLGFALGRGLTEEDRCAVDAIMKAVEKDEYRSHTMVHAIVMSVPFRYKDVSRQPAINDSAHTIQPVDDQTTSIEGQSSDSPVESQSRERIR